MIDYTQLKFDEQGLIPTVVQDYFTKKVLTVAYMNAESLAMSIERGVTCFYSRSRQALWVKGETSGNYQHIVTMRTDCDRDALVVEVMKDGPACHLGTDSCFHETVYQSEEQGAFAVDDLYALLQARKEEKQEGSYTTYLFEQGLDKILKKLGEESTEVIIGAKNSKEETTYEIADLTYHVLVLMVEMGIPLDDVVRELAKRQIVDKKVKQVKMT